MSTFVSVQHCVSACGKMIKLMAKPPESVDDIVRANLKKFRENAGYSQVDAAEASGVPYANLVRYETGKIVSVPYSVIAALGPVYGHPTDDFAKPDPPPARREDLPVFFLRTRPGVDVDSELLTRLQRVIDDANREVRGKRKK